MKKHFVIFLLFLITAVSFAQSNEIIVTPNNPNGWEFGTTTPNKATSASWFLGERVGYPNLGRGSLWFYTGANDGIVWAKSYFLRGTRIADIGRMQYRTFTSVGSGNVAPQINLRVDIDGDGKGDIWITYDPSQQGYVPRNQWATWNTLAGKWWTDRNGFRDQRSMGDWLRLYNTNATVEYLQIQAGTWADAQSNWGWTYFGADLLSVITNGEVIYNFEPDFPPIPGVTPMVIGTSVLPDPTYYVDNGSKTVHEPEDTEAKNPYVTSTGAFVPLVFDGNTKINKILSSIPEVGDPDAKLTGGGAFNFGGVPFYVPKDRNNTWNAKDFNDDDEHKLVIKANLEGVIKVHTVMNLTIWGTEKGPLFIEFKGSKGALYRVELITNKDVRDWHKREGDNIQAPAKVVWSKPIKNHAGHSPCEVRLDSQVFTLPAEFATQELETVTIIDQGNNKSQRVFVVGVTAQIKSVK